MSDLKNFKYMFEKILNNSNNSSIEVTLALSDICYFTQMIASYLNPGDWIFLDGDLGAGKTAFTKELSISLGANQFSTSPTFSIINSEKLNPNKGILNKNLNILNLIHLDLYRIKRGEELFYLGLESAFNIQSSICVFEWPYQVEEEDFENFFKVTNCPRPKRMIEILIDIGSDNLNRTYRIKKIL